MKEVAAQVAEGTVDCGVIYGTDAFSAGLTVVDTATTEMCGRVIYPAAVLNISRHPGGAQAFLDYARPGDGAAVFFLWILAACRIDKAPPLVKGALDALLTLPLVLPPTVMGYLLLLALGPKRAVGPWSLNAFGLKLTMTWWSAVFAAVAVSSPLIYRTARGGFRVLRRDTGPGGTDPGALQCLHLLARQNGRLPTRLRAGEGKVLPGGGHGDVHGEPRHCQRRPPLRVQELRIRLARPRTGTGGGAGLGVVFRTAASWREGAVTLGIRAVHLAEPGDRNAFPCRAVRVTEDVSMMLVMLRPEGAGPSAPLLRIELWKGAWAALEDRERILAAVRPEDLMLLE